jgi:DNA polymerase-1
MSERPKIFLIDAYAVIYRQYHALKPKFTNSLGEPTNALMGMARFFIEILQKDQPDYWAMAFDLGAGGRDKLYPAYKGTRAEMPPDLVPQIKYVYDMARAFNIPILELDDWEADDVIGTVAQQAQAMNLDVQIITGDRDLLQLLTEQVRVLLPSFKGDDILYDIPAFIAKFAVHPTQYIDYKAIVGDSSDNIPGVRGVGDKTTAGLLQTYQTLDGIYDHLDEIKEQVRVKLIADKDNAYLSRQLATIQTNLPIQLDLASAKVGTYDPRVVDKLFGHLGFTTHRNRFRSMFSPEIFTEIEETPEPEATPNPFETIIVDTSEKLDALVQTLNTAGAIVFDTETTGIDPMNVDLVGIALAVDDQRGYYVPVGHIGQHLGTLFAEGAAQQLPMQTVLDALRAPLTNPNIPKFAHNAIYDIVVMQNNGIDITPVTFDTMIAEWVRDPMSRNLGLKNYAKNVLGITMTEISKLIGKGAKQIPMSQVGIDKVAPYAVADAVITFQAKANLETQLQSPQVDMSHLFHKLEMPIIPVIAQMERNGALLDIAELSRQSHILEGQMREREAKIFELAGESFNINSPKKLNDILFDKLKLSTQKLKKTTHGYSTDAVTLDSLRDEHPIIPILMEYRELTKLKSTYIDALPELVNPKTGRVHTSYNQAGASTGRFSSSNPNLQNIPIRTELGREIRKAFIAEEGKYLLSIDYSQIELRVMAHISGDTTLRRAFLDGQDIHKATAAAVYGVPLEQVTYEQRSFAKRVNFGLMYGMGAFRLARDSNLTQAEAKKFVDTYFHQLPDVHRYLEDVKKEAIAKGYVETMFGRKRFFPFLHNNDNPSSQDAQAELRAAINAPIQGTAADILKLALLKLHEQLKNLSGTIMTLQVHDELVFEVPEHNLHDIARILTDTMQNALLDNPIKPIDFAVPLVANAEYGKNWLDMQPLD